MDSIISITLQQEDEGDSCEEKSKIEYKRKEDANGDPQRSMSEKVMSQRENKEEKTPELKQNEEVFAMTKKYLDRVQNAECIHQDTEQSDVTEYRGKTHAK